MQINEYKKGLKAGIPIGLGYYLVSIAFGIVCINNDISVFNAVLISATNLTSAGQFAAIDIIVSNGIIIELILTQFLINIRYSLMSLSLTQKIVKNTSTKDKLLMSFFITDEIFALAISEEEISSKYFYGLSTAPFIGWSMGTLSGALLGSLVNQFILNSLGIALFIMFIAIIVPPAKQSIKLIKVILVAILVSSIIYYIPLLDFISTGFSIIISCVIASLYGAIKYPIEV